MLRAHGNATALRQSGTLALSSGGSEGLAVDIFGSTFLGSGRKHKSCTTILPGENKCRRFTLETLLRRRKPT
jgi:hypothetical protein